MNERKRSAMLQWDLGMLRVLTDQVLRQDSGQLPCPLALPEDLHADQEACSSKRGLHC
jgi:hypothetical protein